MDYFLPKAKKSQRESKFKVYINKGELERIHEWVLKATPNIETGGDLFGLWLDESTAVVQFVLGPGKDCRRTTTSFFQDISYLEHARSYFTKQHGLCNIGQWHSHHKIPLFEPSAGENNTVWSNMPTLGLERFIVFIANRKDSDVTVNSFLFEIKNGRKLPVRKGFRDELQGESPFRSNNAVMEIVRIGAESLNEKDLVPRPIEGNSRQNEVKVVREIPGENGMCGTPSIDNKDKTVSASIRASESKKIVDNSGRENINNNDNNGNSNTNNNNNNNNNNSNTSNTTNNETNESKTEQGQENPGIFSAMLGWLKSNSSKSELQTPSNEKHPNEPQQQVTTEQQPPRASVNPSDECAPLNDKERQETEPEHDKSVHRNGNSNGNNNNNTNNNSKQNSSNNTTNITNTTVNNNNNNSSSNITNNNNSKQNNSNNTTPTTNITNKTVNNNNNNSSSNITNNNDSKQNNSDNTTPTTVNNTNNTASTLGWLKDNSSKKKLQTSSYEKHPNEPQQVTTEQQPNKASVTSSNECAPLNDKERQETEPGHKSVNRNGNSENNKNSNKNSKQNNSNNNTTPTTNITNTTINNNNNNNSSNTTNNNNSKQNNSNNTTLITNITNTTVNNNNKNSSSNITNKNNNKQNNSSNTTPTTVNNNNTDNNNTNNNTENNNSNNNNNNNNSSSSNNSNSTTNNSNSTTNNSNNNDSNNTTNNSNNNNSNNTDNNSSNDNNNKNESKTGQEQEKTGTQTKLQGTAVEGGGTVSDESAVLFHEERQETESRYDKSVIIHQPELQKEHSMVNSSIEDNNPSNHKICCTHDSCTLV